MGNDVVHTPHIDALAAKSARYPNGYVPMSVCRPSLATLLTGLYPHQHGIHFNHPPPGLSVMRKTMTADRYHSTRATTDYLIRNVPTLPRILASHGYACLQTGKHWEGSYKTAGFTHGMTTGLPADRLGPVTGTREQDNGEWVAHGNGDAGLVIGRETMSPITDFLDEHAGKQPFFVWYAPFLPHTPFDAPQKYRDLYKDRSVPKHQLPYFAEIARFDDTVGQLIAALEQRNVLQDTLIVFISDNGFRPRTDNPERQNGRSKLSQFEDGLRTPVLIRWDGHTESAEHRQLVQSVDIVPTVLAACGLADQITQRMFGHNLLRSATGVESLPERPAFGAIYPNDAKVLGKPSQHVRYRWIRDGNYKLIVPGPVAADDDIMFFDLQADPLEQKNLANQPAHFENVTTMTRKLDKWWTGVGDSKVTGH